MAGDWIKVEHATPDKPEVAYCSELLGIPLYQALGLVVAFWIWCDRHARNASVTQVSRISIDQTFHTPGFAAVLEQVGWAKFDETRRILHLPNFERHNEATAKTRALASRRQKRFRNAHHNGGSNAPVTPPPLPEKRRFKDVLPQGVETHTSTARPESQTTKPVDNFGTSKPDTARWWESDTGIERKARELGISSIGKSREDLKNAINRKEQESRRSVA